MGFEAHAISAGSRGAAVFVSTRDDPEPVFILQYRALDPGIPVPRTDSPLSSVTDVQIQFCPWCGVNLKTWYRNAVRELDKSELQVL
jgi:hypothetical protein